MKKYFGEYKFYVKQVAKALGISIEQVSASAVAANKKARNADSIGLSMLFLAERQVLKDGTHYFIETEALAEHLMQIGRNYDSRFLEVIADEKIAYGAIHTCGHQATALLFAWHGQQNNELVVADAKNIEFFHGKEPATQDNPSRNLLFGLCVYLACFPAAVRDGYPEFAKHPAHYKGLRCASVGAAKEILEREGPTAHFRNGHYRILRSERFTNKRWQVIFVRETFIGGKVKTVTEVQPKPRPT